MDMAFLFKEEFIEITKCLSCCFALFCIGFLAKWSGDD